MPLSVSETCNDDVLTLARKKTLRVDSAALGDNICHHDAFSSPASPQPDTAPIRRKVDGGVRFFSVFDGNGSMSKPSRPNAPRAGRRKGCLLNTESAPHEAVPLAEWQTPDDAQYVRPRAVRGPRPPTPPRLRNSNVPKVASPFDGVRLESGSLPPPCKAGRGQLRMLPAFDDPEEPELALIAVPSSEAMSPVRPMAGRRCTLFEMKSM